jgi:hypothetical protein
VNWRFPPPAISPAGSKSTFTTTVTKHTTQRPSEGWLVRYTIANGPPAGFSPDGATSIEVPTNAAGQANAEIFQKTAASGTNQINIEVIRPGTLPGADGKKLIIGRGSSSMTWTTAALPGKDAAASPGGAVLGGAAPGGSVLGGAAGVGPSGESKPAAATTIDLKVSEPPPTQVGGVAKFNITITNYGSQPTGKLRLYDVFEPGLQHKYATTQNHLDLDVGILGPMKQNQVALEFKVTQAGKLCHTVKVLDAGNKTVASRNACVVGIGPATTPSVPGGAQPGTPQPGSLQPGTTQPGTTQPGTTQPGTTQPGISPPTGRYGETLGGGAAAGTPPIGPGTLPGGLGAPPAGKSDLSIKVTGPSAKLTVREFARFSIEITNTGTRKLTNLKVEAFLDPVFERDKASQGFWHDKGVLIYVQRELPAKETLILDIQSICLQPAQRATAFVRVASAEGVQSQGEASCEIVAAAPPETAVRPAESKLQLNVTCPTHPARVGKQFNCLVTVANGGTEEERNVAVEVVVPEGLTIAPMGTTGPTKATIEKQTVRFEPIPSLPPGQRSQTYRVLVQTKKAASYTFTAGVKSEKQSTAILQEKSVDVIQ